jgi:hypothetical protein
MGRLFLVDIIFYQYSVPTGQVVGLNRLSFDFIKKCKMEKVIQTGEHNQSYSVRGKMFVKNEIFISYHRPVRDGILVENEIYTSYRRPVRDGIWITINKQNGKGHSIRKIQSTWSH